MKMILEEIKKVFLDLGFEPIVIDNIEFMKLRESYCKITFINEWNAFVIESADSYEEAKKGILEDGDLFYADTSIEELLNKIRLELINDFILS